MTTTPKNKKYKCDNCGGTFVSSWTDEEEVAESKALWGELPEGSTAQVCDVCFQTMYKNFRNEKVKQ